MSDNKELDPFRDPNGATSWQGQRNAGEWERKEGYTPSPQQSWETAEAYRIRTTK